MKRVFFLSFSLAVGLLELSICSSSLAQTASTPQVPDQLPDQLKAPLGEKLILKASARGSQVYTCQAQADNPNLFEWHLKAPDAELFDDQGQKLGRHYAGPTWQAMDNSKVIGKVSAKANAPQVNAIPWLLLEAKSHAGQGLFTPVRWIQRLNTTGGQAPNGGCDRAHQNQEHRVQYTADYYYYGTPEPNRAAVNPRN